MASDTGVSIVLVGSGGDGRRLVQNFGLWLQ